MSSSESSENLLSVGDQCYKSGSLKLIGQFSRDVIGCDRVKFVNSNWSVSIHRLLVKLSRSVCGLFVGFVYGIC